MSARAIPAHLEREVLARHLEGQSLRAISTWLHDTMNVNASRESVSGVLHRNGIEPEEFAQTEVGRQLNERTDDLTTQLFECLGQYRRLIEESLKPEPAARVTTALQAVKSWASLLIWSLRTAGAQAPAKARMPASSEERDLAILAKYAASFAEERDALKRPAPRAASPIAPAAAAPPRNQACPCGSGAKWKKCCGSPTKAIASSATTSTLAATVSG